jgi:hypothetical protein
MAIGIDLAFITLEIAMLAAATDRVRKEIGVLLQGDHRPHARRLGRAELYRLLSGGDGMVGIPSRSAGHRGPSVDLRNVARGILSGRSALNDTPLRATGAGFLVASRPLGASTILEHTTSVQPSKHEHRDKQRSAEIHLLSPIANRFDTPTHSFSGGMVANVLASARLVAGASPC